MCAKFRQWQRQPQLFIYVSNPDKLSRCQPQQSIVCRPMIDAKNVNSSAVLQHGMAAVTSGCVAAQPLLHQPMYMLPWLLNVPQLRGSHSNHGAQHTRFTSYSNTLNTVASDACCICGFLQCTCSMSMMHQAGVQGMPQTGRQPPCTTHTACKLQQRSTLTSAVCMRGCLRGACSTETLHQAGAQE